MAFQAFFIISLQTLIFTLTLTSTTAIDFNYSYLAVQWPPGYCATTGVQCVLERPKNSYFTIHGLWPMKNGKGEVVNCNGKPFSGDQIYDRDLMEKYWPNFVSFDFDRFWKHEWNKHGKCTGWSQSDYFRITLQRFLDYNVLAHLQGAGIQPSDQYKVKVNDISNALSNLNPQLKCARSERFQGYVLQEIHICVDASGSGIVKCNGPRNKCVNVPQKEDIFLPSS
ncbi:hypothetical protein Tsubulata_002726 [Turnera subulata]|uniref:Uncharacterized protein n=1 Tax=Turnera subulata TaxID=218843 RepID=A0A9Q0JP15_9ROSI|nr:hypothetical protein Tsubulata_002726 [Turnera subulata]